MTRRPGIHLENSCVLALEVALALELRCYVDLWLRITFVQGLHGVDGDPGLLAALARLYPDRSKHSETYKQGLKRHQVVEAPLISFKTL